MVVLPLFSSVTLRPRVKEAEAESRVICLSWDGLGLKDVLTGKGLG